MPEGIEYYNDELFNSLLVPGLCHDCGADAGLTDVPGWTFCMSCAEAENHRSAVRARWAAVTSQSSAVGGRFARGYRHASAV